MIYTSIDQLIGNTPLLELTQIEKIYDLQAKNLIFGRGGDKKSTGVPEK